MTFEELLKKHTKEDGSIDYQAAQSEYDEQIKADSRKEVDATLSKNSELIEEKRKVQERLEALENELNDTKKKSASSNEDYKELYETEKTAREKEIESYKNKFGRLKGSALDSKITKALKDAGVKDEFIKFVKRDFMYKADLDITDEDIKAIAKIGDSSIDINEYIKNQLEKEDYQSILSAPINSGGGAGGSGKTDVIADNPFSKENWNMDKQQELYVNNQAQYELLKKSAQDNAKK